MSKTLANLTDDFIGNAQIYEEALENGNSKLANKKHDDAGKILKKIREFGDIGDEAILQLTNHENISVRLWAAVYSLKYNVKRAEKVLKDISNSKGAIGFSAKMILEEKSKGNLDLP